MHPQFQVLLTFIVSLFPLAVYCLILAGINRRDRPLVVRGVWDFAGVLAALSGILLWTGPVLLQHLMRERFDDLLTPALRAAGPDLGPRVCMVMEQQPGETVTLTHADTRADNLFFRAATRPLELVLVDWQNVRRSFTGAWDVVYFLTSAFASDTRRQYEGELLALYHQTLEDHGVAGYPWEQFWADCRRAALTIFASTGVVAGGVIGWATPRLGQVLQEWVSGMIGAVNDYDAMALLPA
jgi:hypothetical protein